ALPWALEGRRDPLQVRPQPGAELQCRGLDLDIARRGKELAHCAENPATRGEIVAAPRQGLGPPPRLAHCILLSATDGAFRFLQPFSGWYEAPEIPISSPIPSETVR